LIDGTNIQLKSGNQGDSHSVGHDRAPHQLRANAPALMFG
jgi:hypothetical protein